MGLHTVTVGDYHTHAALRPEHQVSAGGDLLGDEIVRGTGVKEFAKRRAVDGDPHLHSLTSAHTRDGQHGDRGLVGQRLHGALGVDVVFISEGDEEKALTDTVMAVPELLIAIETKAQPPPFVHLRG
jgi:hypothetical protein